MKKPQAPPLFLTLTGTVRGATHRRDGKPNQDSVFAPASRGGNAVAISVADGCGSDQHCRSNIGSQAAAQGACEVLSSLVDSDFEGGNPSAAIAEIVRTQVQNSLVADWTKRILAYHEENPFGPCDLGLLGKDEQSRIDAHPLLAYSTTALAASACKGFGVVSKIGDGVIRIIDHAGKVYSPFPEIKSSRADATESMCMKDAASRIQTDFVHFGVGVPKCIFLATDGYSKQFRSSQLVDKNVVRIFDHLCEHGVEDFQRALTKLLQTTSKEFTGDDVSIALLTRRDCLSGVSTGQYGQRRFA
ncbi:MAG: protein phosphatase 2C domain-containing protein [Pseudomonadota bacterium]